MQKIFDEINNLKISDILSMRLELQPHGNEWTALCPFHDDHKVGSFLVNDSKGVFKCFSCGEGGNGIKFIAKYDGISYYAAALKIALKFGIINKTEYQKLSKDKPNVEELQQLRQRKKKEAVDEYEIADTNTLNYVYTLLSMGNKLCDGSTVLSQEHLDYLHERGINDDEITKYGYFTMPSRKALSAIVKQLKQRGNDAEMLLGVPGFYRYRNSNKISMNTMQGIGIPIRNVDGDIVGIQVRRDNIKDGAKRYRWFTSAINDLSKTEYCLSPGSPLDVVIPEKIKFRTIFVTEGHFKAAAIAKQFGCSAISVQGIGNYTGIEEVIKKLNVSNFYDHVYIAYDADMAYNIQVYKQAVAMGNKIQKEFPNLQLSYVLWDVDKGKGIDDLINSGNAVECWQVPFIKFQQAYNQLLMDLMKEQNVLKIKDLKINKDSIKARYMKDVYMKLKTAD